MQKPLISLAVAMDRGGVIGRDGTLPWHITEDLRHFKALTWGKPIVMGRRTFEAIGRPLPGRHNIVVSRTPGFQAPGCTVTASVDQALAAAGEVPEVVVIGGGVVYAETLPLAGRLYITLVHAEVEGDTWFPHYDPADWRECEREGPFDSATSPYSFEFIVTERRDAPGSVPA